MRHENRRLTDVDGHKYGQTLQGVKETARRTVTFDSSRTPFPHAPFCMAFYHISSNHTEGQTIHARTWRSDLARVTIIVPETPMSSIMCGDTTASRPPHRMATPLPGLPSQKTRPFPLAGFSGVGGHVAQQVPPVLIPLRTLTPWFFCFAASSQRPFLVNSRKEILITLTFRERKANNSMAGW